MQCQKRYSETLAKTCNTVRKRCSFENQAGDASTPSSMKGLAPQGMALLRHAAGTMRILGAKVRGIRQKGAHFAHGLHCTFKCRMRATCRGTHCGGKKGSCPHALLLLLPMLCLVVDPISNKL